MTEQLPNPANPRNPRGLDTIAADIIGRIPPGLTDGSTTKNVSPVQIQPYIVRSRSPLEELWDQTQSSDAGPINEPMAGSVLARHIQSALRLLDENPEQNRAPASEPARLQAEFILRGVHELTGQYDPDDLLPADKRLSFETLATTLAQTMEAHATAQGETQDPATHQAVLEGVRLATEVFTTACLGAQFE